MVRSKAQDAQPGTVTVDQLAFGLAALDCTVWEDPGTVWRAMDYRARDEYLAKARFALGLAEETTDAELGQLRWPPESLPPAGVVVSGRLVPGRLVSSEEPSGEPQ